MGFYIIKTIAGQKHQKKKEKNHPEEDSTGGEGDKEKKYIVS